MNIKRKILIAMSVIMMFTVACKKQKEEIEDPTENEIEEEEEADEDESENEEEEEEEIDGDKEDEKDKIDKSDDEVAKDDNISKDEPSKPSKPSTPNKKEPVKDKPAKPSKPKKPSKPTPGKQDKPIKVESKVKNTHSLIKKSLGEDYTANMEMSKEQLGSILSTPLDGLGEFIAEVPMMSTHVDTFIGIDAKDKVKSVENDLKKYRESLINESMQYPMNMAKVKASKVITVKNDVYFIMLGAFDNRNEVSEEEQLKFAKQEVEKIEKLIRSQY